MAFRLRKPVTGAERERGMFTFARLEAAEVVNELAGANENALHAEASTRADSSTLLHIVLASGGRDFTGFSEKKKRAQPGGRRGG